MAFEKKEWKDRITEYPTRRTLVKEGGSTEIVTVERNEGSVSQEGDAFSAENMNDLEQRIEDGLEELKYPKNKMKYLIGSLSNDYTRNGYNKIAQISVDREDNISKNFSITLRIQKIFSNADKEPPFVRPITITVCFIVPALNTMAKEEMVMVYGEPSYRYSALASSLYVRRSKFYKQGAICEIFWKKTNNWDAIEVTNLNESDRIGGVSPSMVKTYDTSDRWTLYAGAEAFANGNETSIEQENHIYYRISDVINTSGPDGDVNMVASATVKEIKVVDSLPSNAASHPEIIYFTFT